MTSKAQPKESFKCSFTNCNGEKTKSKVSGDPLFTNEVIECFLEAYNNSGYCNKLSIILHGGHEGDILFTSNIQNDKQGE